MGIPFAGGFLKPLLAGFWRMSMRTVWSKAGKLGVTLPADVDRLMGKVRDELCKAACPPGGE